MITRLVRSLLVLFGISVLVFLIFFATPGVDPAALIAGKNASPEVLQNVRHSFGFDQPLYVQYLLLMKRLFITGDLTSFVNRGQQVLPSIVQAVPVTLSLVVGAAVLWVVGGVTVGVMATVWRGAIVDRGRMLARGTLDEIRGEAQLSGPLEELFLKLTGGDRPLSTRPVTS